MRLGGLVNIREMMANGFRFYRIPSESNFECNDLRSLENHLWHMAELLSDLNCSALGHYIPNDNDQVEAYRIVKWLQMAASLQIAHIDTGNHAQPAYMCEGVAEYEAADDEITSAYATEYTRLLYAWCAVERLLHVIELPSVPRFEGYSRVAGNWHAGTYLLSSIEPVEHYMCTLRHMVHHVKKDATYRSMTKLHEAFDLTPWRSPSGVLLMAANQLRHMPAHGDLTIPGPHSLNGQQASLHVPRLAVRGLLMSIQMILAVLADPNDYWNGNIGPQEGWWVRDTDGSWTRPDEQTQPVAAIIDAHLRPAPDGEEVSRYE